MFAKLNSRGIVEVYDGHNIPTSCFGHGENIVSVSVQGNEIYCNCKNGTTHVYVFTGSTVQPKTSFR